MGSQVRRPGPDYQLVDVTDCSRGASSNERRLVCEGLADLEIREEQDRRQFLAGEECQDPGGSEPA